MRRGRRGGEWFVVSFVVDEFCYECVCLVVVFILKCLIWRENEGLFLRVCT